MREITICTGNSCKSKAAGLLVKKAERKLNCYIGFSDPNQKVILTDHECLGNCKSGPSIRLDCYIFPQVSEQEIEFIIEAIQDDKHEVIDSITKSATIDLSRPLMYKGN